MKYQYFSNDETSKFTDSDLTDVGVRLTSRKFTFEEHKNIQLWKGSSGSGFYLVDSLLQNVYKSFPISIFRAMKPTLQDFENPTNEFAYESHMLWTDYYNIYDNLTNFFNIKDSL